MTVDVGAMRQGEEAATITWCHSSPAVVSEGLPPATIFPTVVNSNGASTVTVGINFLDRLIFVNKLRAYQVIRFFGRK